MIRILVFSSLVIFTQATIPSYLKVCNANNPDVAKCVKDSVEMLRPYLAKGITEMNIPALEPFEIGDLYQSSLNLTMTDFTVNGLANYDIQNITVDLHKFRFAFLVHLSNLVVTSKYSIETKLLTIPLRGNGDLTAKIPHLVVSAKLMGKRQPKDGKTFIEMSLPELKIATPTEATLELNGLFSDNEQLGKAADIIVEENTLHLVEEIIKVAEPKLKDKIENVANHVTNTYSEEELFPGA